jgi:ferredoxin-NADP reductase
MSALPDPRAVLDRQLGRVTMYRLVTIVLAVLVLVMLAFTAAGTFTDPFTVRAELTTLAVLVVASVASSWILAAVWRVRPHTESSVITALLLFFLFWPSTDAVDLAWLAAAAALANASKYVLAWRGRHVLNPAAAGAFLVIVVQDLVGRETPVNATWWVAAEKLLPFVAVGALLVLWRTRRLTVGLTFVVVAGALEVVGLHHLDQAWGAAIESAAYSFPIVFLAGFMLSEPLTLPPRRHQQLVVAVVTALVFAYPIAGLLVTDTLPELGVLRPTPELALLVGNLVAFAFARRRGLELRLEERRQLTPQTHELVFRAARPLAFEPGQYAELTVPHGRADTRGTRRAFSISSPPADDGRVTFALRVPEPSSSFKRALLELEPGASVRATGVGGDFRWPSDTSVPLLLVAGGIGVTPFLSQLRHHTDRDVVLVYGVAGADEVPFRDELADVRVVLVGPERPADLPGGWTYVQAPFLTPELIAEAVPDLGDRRAYVSGPPGMVDALRRGLARRCRGLRTDYFSGY